MFFLLLAQNVQQGIHGIQHGFFVSGGAFFGYVVVAGNDKSDFAKLVGVTLAVFEERYVGANNFVTQVEEFADFFMDVVLKVFAGFEVDALDVDAHFDQIMVNDFDEVTKRTTPTWRLLFLLATKVWLTGRNYKKAERPTYVGRPKNLRVIALLSCTHGVWLIGRSFAGAADVERSGAWFWWLRRLANA
jgi:hypothetical protein